MQKGSTSARCLRRWNGRHALDMGWQREEDHNGARTVPPIGGQTRQMLLSYGQFAGDSLQITRDAGARARRRVFVAAIFRHSTGFAHQEYWHQAQRRQCARVAAGRSRHPDRFHRCRQGCSHGGARRCRRQPQSTLLGELAPSAAFFVESIWMPNSVIFKNNKFNLDLFSGPPAPVRWSIGRTQYGRRAVREEQDRRHHHSVRMALDGKALS